MTVKGMQEVKGHRSLAVLILKNLKSQIVISKKVADDILQQVRCKFGY